MTQRYDPFGSNSYSTASNPWAGFFGTPPFPYKTTSYDKYDRHNYNLPEAYVGQNKMLRATVDELIYTDEDWYTSVALPYQFTDQLSVAWDKWEFNEHFTNIVPEQGVSRLVSSHKEQRSESFVRRGMAAIFEHGFMSTPDGRANYVLTLRQIARAVKETTNFGVIYAYLTAHNYNRTWEEKHGYFRKNTLSELLKRNKAMWAIAQKEKNGMEKLDAQIVEWMNRYRGEADTWIIPPKMTIFLRLVPTEKTDYYIAGEEGPRRVNDIVGSGRPRESNAKRVHDMVEPFAVFKKSRVYITRTYHVDRTGPIDLMSRVSQIGEYNTMIDEMDTCGYDSYDSCHRTIRIYDEDNDRGHNFTLTHALNACNLFDTDGKLKNVDFSREMNDDQDLLQDFLLRQVTDPRSGRQMAVPVKYFGDIAERFMSISSIGNLAETLINNIYLTATDRRQAQERLAKGIAMIRRLNNQTFRPVDQYAPETVTVSGAPVAATQGTGVVTDVVPVLAATNTAAPRDMGAFPNNGTDIEDIAGATSWTALNILAVGAARGTAAPYVGAGNVAADFVTEIRTMADRLAGLLGTGSNIFLDPGNSLPNERDASSAATLYNNLINHDASIVYRLGDAGGAQGNPELAPKRAAMETMLAAFLNTDPAAAGNARDALVARGVDIAAGGNYQNIRAQILALTTGGAGVAFDDAILTDQNLQKMRRLVGSNWKYTQANGDAQIQRWLDEVVEIEAKAQEQIVEQNRILGGQAPPQRVAYANAQMTILMAYPSNASFSGAQRDLDLGFDLASRFDLNRVRDRERAVVGRGGTERQLALIGSQIGSNWQADRLPVFAGVAAAEQRAQRQGGPSKQMRDDSFRIGSGLAGYQSQQIEAMAGLGFDRDGAPRAGQAAIQQQRNWIPAAAGHLQGAGRDVPNQQVSLRMGNMAYLLDRISKSPMNPLRKLAAAVYLSAEVHKRTFESFVAANILFPMGFLLLRPHARYEMALGIKCKAGLDTGATYFGHSNFMLSDDATVKVHYGHYTHYGKSVVHNEKNVFIAYDIFANRALGGLGVVPYIKGARGTTYNTQRDDYGDASVFVVAIPYEEKMIPNPIDIAGRFYSYMDKGFIDYEDPSQRKLHYTTAPRYNRMWGWYNPANVMDEVDEPLYRTQYPNINRVCWQGAQGGFNPEKKDFSKIIRNTSPWGPNVSTGCRATRDGQMQELEKVPFGVLGF